MEHIHDLGCGWEAVMRDSGDILVRSRFEAGKEIVLPKRSVDKLREICRQVEIANVNKQA